MSGPDDTLDWEFCRRFLKKYLSNRLRRHPAVVDDAVQEALIRLLRATRKGLQIDNLEAFMIVIAQRVASSLERAMKPTETIGDPPTAPPPPIPKVELHARLRFAVLEIFQALKSPCLEVAKHYFEEKQWEVVATALGRSVVAIRKQWSRCLDALREQVRDSRDPIWFWARDEEA